VDSLTPRVVWRIAAATRVAIIVKEKGEFCVRSPNNKDWNGGCYPSKGEAEKRLSEVEYFKHNKAMVERVAASYKSKKKVKTKDGDEMTVYEYSDRQIANRDKKKAERIDALKKSIGKLRTKYKSDLSSDDEDTAQTALAVALIDHTYERVGNDDSAKDGHFGVTGWRKKHVSFGSGGATIRYVGKSGVDHDKKVTDAGIKKALKKAYEAAKGENSELLPKATAEKVNAYLKDFDVTAKDLRGYHANREMQERLKAIRSKGKELPEDKKEREKLLKKEFLKALDETSDAVGHEPSTLRSQYLVPNLEEAYTKDGTVLDKFSS
jgi:DNA topoisomerase IB